MEWFVAFFLHLWSLYALNFPRSFQKMENGLYGSASSENDDAYFLKIANICQDYKFMGNAQKWAQTIKRNWWEVNKIALTYTKHM